MLKCNEWEITFNMLIVTCQGNKTKSKQCTKKILLKRERDVSLRTLK